MTKSKKKCDKSKPQLSAAQRLARRKHKREFMILFINGKQKRVCRPPLIGGLPVDEFIARNADPIWLHQNEHREDIVPEPDTPWENDEPTGDDG